MLTDAERVRVLAQLFTRPFFASLAQRGDWRHSLHFLRKHHLLVEAPPKPFAILFEKAWKEIRTSYRNEYVYKNEIANRIMFERHRPHTAACHIELPIGRSIVDLAIFNGTSTAYEIKTEFDSAKRLETQTADYQKAFMKVFVVAHPTFAYRYAEATAENVGVLSLNLDGSLSTIKKASLNQEYLDPSLMFRCLRQEEYTSIAGTQLSGLKSIPNGLISDICRDFFVSLDKVVAHKLYAKALLTRKIDLQTAEFVTSLPTSLKALGFATPLSGRHRRVLSEVLLQRIPVALA